MTFSLRSISNLFKPYLFTRPLQYFQTFNIQREQIPPIRTQHHYYHSWVRKALESITGMKMLTTEETRQAIIDHQKLWVAHYSIHNHLKTHKHYEMFYSMQLFKNPKDFSIQQHYTILVDKEKEKLSIQELQQMVNLYQFAIDKEENLFVSCSLKQKLNTYLSILENRLNGK